MKKPTHLHDFSTEYWVMTYIMEFAETPGKYWPEVHGIYATWQEANEDRNTKINPKNYNIVRGYMMKKVN